MHKWKKNLLLLFSKVNKKGVSFKLSMVISFGCGTSKYPCSAIFCFIVYHFLVWHDMENMMSCNIHPNSTGIQERCSIYVPTSWKGIPWAFGLPNLIRWLTFCGFILLVSVGRNENCITIRLYYLPFILWLFSCSRHCGVHSWVFQKQNKANGAVVSRCCMS